MHFMISPSPEVRQSFPKPPEWEGFVAVVGEAYDPSKPESEQIEAIDALWETAHPLDAQTIEDNRYFGVGRTICAIAKSSFKPIEDPESIANLTMSNLITQHPNYCKHGTKDTTYPQDQGLYLTEIAGPSIAQMPPHIRSEFRAMDWAERTVINGLQLAHFDKVDLSDPMNGFIKELVLEEDGGLIGALDSTYAAASSILIQSLVLHCKEKGMDTSGSNFNPPLKDIVSEEKLPTLLPAATAARASTLRLDEFKNLPTYLKLDETGKSYVDRSLIPKDPPKLSELDCDLRSQIFHELRIGCPALYIGGAIPYATNTLLQVISGAQRQLLKRVA